MNRSWHLPGDPGIEEGPRHELSSVVIGSFTWPLLDLNNVDLNGYVKSPILSHYIWFLKSYLQPP